MKFDVILSDPAWAYNDKMTGHSFSVDKEYTTEKACRMEDLPVQDLADKNCAMFMWAVSPQLPEALALMKAWGFKFKTVAFVWSKYTKNGKLVSNLGKWTMGNVEMVLLGTKGKPQRLIKNVKQIVHAERTEHSAKPAEVRRRIDTLMGDVARVELFAREWAEGWVPLGNEIDGRDLRVTIPELAAL